MNYYLWCMAILRIFLYPFSLLYGLGVYCRNKMFDWGILKSVCFDVPVIGVGNLSTGGTGKTPQVEYLIELLSKDYKIAVLSRGYKRKTKGFVIAQPGKDAKAVGDEPLQIHKNYPDILVAVCEKRVEGINKLLELHPEIELIILDDSFQHRYVKPRLNILLTDYYKLFNYNFLLPCGNLREPKSQAKRADILVVTKTPAIFSPLDRKIILKRVSRYKTKNIFFSYINYKKWEPLTEAAEKFAKGKSKTIFLLTGIANPSALEEKLKTQCEELICYNYRDHHSFQPAELQKLKDRFKNTLSASKVVITTQKDAMRLQKPELMEVLNDIPVYILPIQTEFHKEDKKAFDDYVIKKIKK